MDGFNIPPARCARRPPFEGGDSHDRLAKRSWQGGCLEAQERGSLTFIAINPLA